MHQVSQNLAAALVSARDFSRCLTAGLPRDASVYEGDRKFDESAYHHYETVRERLVQLFEEASIQYMRTPFVGSPEEVAFTSDVDAKATPCHTCLDRMYRKGLRYWPPTEE